MYSQCGEDDVILKIFGEYVGRFLDIGAHDGRYLSNTLALIERGWSGVMVEANPRTFARLLDNHGQNQRLTLINAAVGLEWKITQFWPATTDDGLSTTEEAQRQRREAEGRFGLPYCVVMAPLWTVSRFVPGPYDFVSIDTEGTSVQLFSCIASQLGGLPQVICVEHDGDMCFCRQFAYPLGYREVCETAINLIFQR